MCIETYRGRPDVAHGFTLIELIITIVVLSTGLAGILLVYNQTVARSADPMLQQQAIALAEGYMEEILGMRCPGDSAGGTQRGEWGFVADYHGLDDSPPRDVRGDALAGLEQYRIQVVVAATSLNGVPGCQMTVLATYTQDAGIRSELIGFRAED